MRSLFLKISKSNVYLAAFFLLCFVSSSAQTENDSIKKGKNWFVGLDYGIQMSGIKNEDFIPSNYSPVYRLYVGREISPNLAVQVGYQGTYFRVITDDLRYRYDFYFVEGILNATNIIFGKDRSKKYNMLLHAGPGIFYHHRYGRTSIHGVLGLANTFALNDRLDVKFDLSAIVGYDIYQGDNDILPNSTLGLIYHF